MKLTKTDREAFVRAVMNDVPMVDYNEKARALAMEHLVASLPSAVRALWNDNALRGYVKVIRHYTQYPLDNITGPEGDFSIAVTAQLDSLATAMSDQNDERRELQERLAGVIAGCSTLAKATKVLPEFVKYLPADRDGTGVTNLPAISGVVADLTKAGWPKEQATA
jgi:hypothetical protein